jgi:hypothetical protein
MLSVGVPDTSATFELVGGWTLDGEPADPRGLGTPPPIEEGAGVGFDGSAAGPSGWVGSASIGLLGDAGSLGWGTESSPIARGRLNGPM